MFLNFLNKFHKNIQFTLEIGKEKSLNFLDLNLTLIGNKIDFNIFRKDTYTDTVIHNSSNHPFTQKLAAFHSMVNRLVTIPLSVTNFTLELNLIKQIAVNNGYSTKLIDQLLNKKNKQKFLKLYIYPFSKHNNNQWRRILFVNNDISKIISKNIPGNIQPAFYANNKFKKFILNNKDSDIKTKKSGVYKLDCKDCNSFYIGRTNRNFEVRVKEHLRALNGNSESEFADHLINNNHNFDINHGLKILHTGYKASQINNLEILEIRKNVNNKADIINKQQIFVNPLLNLFPLNRSFPANGFEIPN